MIQVKVEDFNSYCKLLIDGLEKSDLSLLVETNSLASKQMAVSAASCFEVELCKKIERFVHEASRGNEEVRSLLRAKAIKRQFHTWFDWNQKNANQFFGLFGVQFKQHMQDMVNNDDTLRESICSFLELGKDRNEIVHSDFLNFSYDKTLDEVYNLYKKARLFVDMFPEVLVRFSAARESAPENECPD